MKKLKNKIIDVFTETYLLRFKLGWRDRNDKFKLNADVWGSKEWDE